MGTYDSKSLPMSEEEREIAKKILGRIPPVPDETLNEQMRKLNEAATEAFALATEPIREKMLNVLRIMTHIIETTAEKLRCERNEEKVDE